MPMPLIFLIAIFMLVLITFSVLVGIGGRDWRASLRLFLLGMGLLGVFLAFGAALFYLPDWIIVPFLLAAALLPWVIILRYFIMTRLNGRLLILKRSVDLKIRSNLRHEIVLMLEQNIIRG